jgi:DNA-binding PadR family transcriptional regulator
LPMEKPTICRNLERMRKNGWIEVAAGVGGPDRTVAVTPAGRKLLATLYPENNVVNLTPMLQKSEGFRVRPRQGCRRSRLLQALGNAGSEVLRLSRRGKKMA